MSYCTQDAPEIDKWRDMAGHQKARADALAARLAEADWLLRTLTVDDVSPEWLKRWQAWTRTADSADAAGVSGKRIQTA